MSEHYVPVSREGFLKYFHEKSRYNNAKRNFEARRNEQSTAGHKLYSYFDLKFMIRFYRNSWDKHWFPKEQTIRTNIYVPQANVYTKKHLFVYIIYLRRRNSRYSRPPNAFHLFPVRTYYILTRNENELPLNKI